MKPLRLLLPAALVLAALLGVVQTSRAQPFEFPVTLYLPLIMRTAPNTAWIPAGSFNMGCNAAIETCSLDEQPLHTVSISAYRIDLYETTNAAYQGCVAAGKCTQPHLLYSETRDPYYADPQYAQYPVASVDWRQATEYCAWVGGRLPTEAEWEKAARGTADTRSFPWGEAAPGCILLNFFNGQNYCVGDTSRVGTYPSGASPYGVMDMAGNMWEWVADWYQDDYYDVSPSVDPQGPATGAYRVLRGGSYYSDSEFTRNAVRLAEDPATWYPNAGFRCAY